jgi:hypothetical protein
MPAQETFGQWDFAATPIRNLGLTIKGTRLEPILAEFEKELQRVSPRQLQPHFYLSTEWGVPFDTIAIAIPFYLARPDLTALHTERVGHIEGLSKADILRYLRHEMGHVVNYAYRLYEDKEWVKLFGSIAQPYLEDYRPEPFDPRFVRHLPGWYAQKHPDEDWAETFAIWMTPGTDWRSDYADRPEAQAKLVYCDLTLAALADRPPLVTATELDDDVSDLPYSLEQFYHGRAAATEEFPRGLDGALRAIFEDDDEPADGTTSAAGKPAATLIRRLERDLMAHVYLWTGHFPERTRPLLRHLASRAEALHLVYPQVREAPVVIGLTSLVTALAMNYIHHDSYLPRARPSARSE